MIDINAVLQYQDLDMQIVKTEAEVEKSEHLRAAYAAQNAVIKTRESAAALEKQAEELVKFFERTLSFYNENAKKIEELQKKFDTELSEEEYDNYKGMLKKFTDSFAKLEQTLSGYDKSIKDVMAKFAEFKAGAKKSMADFTESRRRYEELKKEKQPQIEDLRKKMAALEKQIGKDLLTKYANLRRDRTLPPVVVLMDKSCGGCRMEMSMATLSTLKQNGVIDCEFCHRIIYVK